MQNAPPFVKLPMLNFRACIQIFVGLAAASVLAQEPPFPLASVVEQARQAASSAKVTPSGLTRDDYLKTTEGIVEYFRKFQAPTGRIIDPFLHKEVQYSTPCYAWSAAALVASGHQTNLFDSAAQALDVSLEELSTGHAADGHSDFFTFPCMLAYEALRDHVAPERRAKWEAELRSIVPEKIYHDIPGKRPPHNWAIVALSGEYLRAQDGLGDPAYVDKALSYQMKYFTANGQYMDPNVPMAYDGFPRCFLAAMIDRGYKGAYATTLSNLMDRAAWTSLLIQSPIGEWPTGGRSSEHQWNEAMQCMTYEVWARLKQGEGDAAGAAMFKRAARLALESVRRWVRPSGELWIVKNRFDPAERHGFMGYSSHSQYNLLAASMLCTAWLYADEAIPEGVCPAESGGFALELPDFHKVIANAGGLYVELDTSAAPEYNSTGLIRVHKTGVDPLVGPTDVSDRKDGSAAAGIAWREGDHWQSLAALTKKDIKRVEFSTEANKPGHVQFKVRYVLGSPHVSAVVENYDLTPERVEVAAEVQGETDQVRVRFPALAFDGANATRIEVKGAKASVQLNRSRENVSIVEPSEGWVRTGTWTSFRNGFFEMIECDIPGKRVVYDLAPTSAESAP
ncbi:MAG TPA: hypothetical protein VH619_10045 [Verrucomicrobiae bacterium]|nr:hypothetical protein [Verrucomicrobiae bacterium]